MNNTSFLQHFTSEMAFIIEPFISPVSGKILLAFVNLPLLIEEDPDALFGSFKEEDIEVQFGAVSPSMTSNDELNIESTSSEDSMLLCEKVDNLVSQIYDEGRKFLEPEVYGQTLFELKTLSTVYDCEMLLKELLSGEPSDGQSELRDFIFSLPNADVLSVFYTNLMRMKALRRAFFCDDIFSELAAIEIANSPNAAKALQHLADETIMYLDSSSHIPPCFVTMVKDIAAKSGIDNFAMALTLTMEVLNNEIFEFYKKGGWSIKIKEEEKSGGPKN